MKQQPVPEKAAETQQASQPDVLTGVVATLERINARLDAFQEALTAPAPDPLAFEAPKVELPPAVSDEEINDAIRTAENPAAVLRGMVKRELAAVVKSEVEPLRTVGLGALGDLARRAAVPEMRHYQRFKGEIDSYIARLDPSLRSRPETWKVAHDAVVGMHHDQLANEAVEEAIRKARDEGTAAPGAGGPGGQGQTKVPSVEEVAGADAAALLKMRGLTPDEFARRIGYESWSDYVKMAQTLEEELA